MPPKRVTRSGGPPQSAAVVNPTKSSSKKKKKKARQAGKTQGPSPISSGTTAGATEDAGDAHFLHLSRLAKDLRDSAVGHPGAQSALLDLLKKKIGRRKAATRSRFSQLLQTGICPTRTRNKTMTSSLANSPRLSGS